MDVSTFRSTFPAFSDTATYPDAQVESLIDLAGEQMVSKRWSGAIKERAIALFVAHHLVLDAKADAGGTPGTVQGPATSKSIAGVSVSYDLSNVTHERGGYWNTTSYGIQFLRLARMIGAGPIQAGMGDPNNGLRVWV